VKNDIRRIFNGKGMKNGVGKVKLLTKAIKEVFFF